MVLLSKVDGVGLGVALHNFVNLTMYLWVRVVWGWFSHVGCKVPRCWL